MVDQIIVCWAILFLALELYIMWEEEFSKGCITISTNQNMEMQVIQ